MVDIYEDMFFVTLLLCFFPSFFHSILLLPSLFLSQATFLSEAHEICTCVPVTS
jgi:hypothetical protein